MQKQILPKEKNSTNSFKFEKKSSKKNIIKTQSKEKIPTGKEIFNVYSNSNDLKYENKEENQMNINAIKSNYRKSGELLFNPKISKKIDSLSHFLINMSSLKAKPKLVVILILIVPRSQFLKNPKKFSHLIWDLKCLTKAN